MADTTRRPERSCDIVMKGGVTSGVVYPLAVCELAKSYRFRSIGGTSAGAIAAAAAAAAERGRASGGFEKLARLPEWLGAQQGGRSHLFSLFQPQPATRAAFATATAALERGPWVGLLRIVGHGVFAHPLSALLGLVPGAVVAADATHWHGILLGVSLAALGMVVACAVAFATRLLRALPRNGYGLCSGMPGTGAKGAPALTEWLADYLDDLAGLPKEPGALHAKAPLTFGDLWWADPDDQSGERDIDLQMMTTCLSQGRPYRLPFRDEDGARESRLFLFDPEELRRLFPARIVDWMVAHARSCDASERAAYGKLCAFPEPTDLPVVVAVRMSLSFPILLSAVPLYAIDRTKSGSGRPERCWFSDGGICSNFPVHFFDSPLPRWPTFAIDLRDGRAEGQEPVWVPSKNHEGLAPSWLRIDDGGARERVLRFLGSVFGAMQNWGDNAQLHMPGYRDRIAHVTLARDEGGLNLDMPEERIQKLAAFGQEAGSRLAAKFTQPSYGDSTGWDNHRWVRLRSLLAAVEEMAGRIEKACAAPMPGDVGYEEWLADGAQRPAPSYAFSSRAQRDSALATLRELRELASRLLAARTLADGAPQPRPELRTRPRV